MGYNLELIDAYVNCNDIEGYDIDKLENDPLFMKQVILYTNDKNFYDLCSDELKSNYDFISFIVTRFNNEPRFIDKVAMNFFERTTDPDERLSLIVKMYDLLKKSNNDNLLSKYKVLFLVKFSMDVEFAESYKKENPEDSFIGLGFIIFQSQYQDENIIKYYAMHLIDYIFAELEPNLERKVKELKNNEIFKYLINTIRKHDSALADYATMHKDILAIYEEKIKNTINPPEDDKLEDSLFQNIFKEVHEYYIDNKDEISIKENDFLVFIGYELGIGDKTTKYLGIKLNDYELNNLNDRMIDILLSNRKDMLMYANIKRIIINSFMNEKKQSKVSGKVIEVDFNKNRK